MKNLLVVFVCSGNTCRSPMAEYMFRQLIEGEDIEGIEVMSAGLKTEGGKPISEEAIRAMASRGVKNAEGHISKPFDKNMFKKADLIVAMSRLIGSDLEEIYGENKKIVTLGDLPNTESVDDPYGKGFFEYHKACGQIEVALPQILRYISKNLRKI